LNGTLARNFMGYTVKAAPDMVGFGISAIGDVGGAYVQNAKKLSEYYPALDAGRLPVEKGCVLSDDDMLRRYVIHSLMCNFELDTNVVKARFGVEFDRYFAEELAELDSTIDPGFYERRGEKMIVLPLGQLFVRNVVMPFDKYLKQTPKDKPLFSRTV
jgi:oxygen-independent coproporphyrinogen-3 oxidase